VGESGRGATCESLHLCVCVCVCVCVCCARPITSSTRRTCTHQHFSLPLSLSHTHTSALPHHSPAAFVVTSCFSKDSNATGAAPSSAFRLRASRTIREEKKGIIRVRCVCVGRGEGCVVGGHQNTDTPKSVTLLDDVTHRDTRTPSQYSVFHTTHTHIHTHTYTQTYTTYA
jgi:hypothetical protein